MLGRNKNTNKKNKAGAKNKQQKGVNKDEAAIKIQCLVRRFLAFRRVIHRTNQVWVRVFDPTYKKYFWFDQLHQISSWKQPKYVQLFTEDDIYAVTTIQRFVRGFVHRVRAKKLANQKYSRFYDSDTNKFYWLNKETKQTTYKASNWLQRQDIQMPKEDRMLLESQLKIKELEMKLAEKELMIKEIRQKRYEELEPEVIRDKVKHAKNLERSKYIDEWTTDDLAAFMTELKMEEYIPNLYKNRVDGTLFINLEESEYVDLGIANKFHIRKLQLILKPYRTRYQRKQDKKLGRTLEDDDDELLSEYSPSELSALLAAEDNHADDGGQQIDNDNDDSSDDENSYGSDEEDVIPITEEQLLQKKMDEENIKIDSVMLGDGENFPLVGDIVRVKYVCLIAGTNKVVMNTKNTLERPWVEFALGFDQVIKGFERSLPMMSVGERSKLTFTPQYAYGDAGLPPHIPPNTSITFDVTLLGFRPRTLWVKPLIQDINTNEKPHWDDLKQSLEFAAKSGQPQRVAQIMSSALLLTEGGELAKLVLSPQKTTQNKSNANNSNNNTGGTATPNMQSSRNSISGGSRVSITKRN